MKYFALSVCDYMEEQIGRHRRKESESRALLMLPSYPAEVLTEIGRELETRASQSAELVYKIAKPLWQEWQQSALTSVKQCLAEAGEKGWLDEEGNLTNYRNSPSEALGMGATIVLAGIDHVTDASGLSDFHCCSPATVWSEVLDESFGPWIVSCLEREMIAYEPEDTIARFDHVLKALLERVPTDIIRISELLDGLALGDAQNGQEAERILLQSLQLFNLPRFTGYRFRAGGNFPPYVESALAFFSYDMFLEQTPRRNAEDAVEAYRAREDRQENALRDEGQIGHYSSDDAFLDELSAYIREGGSEQRDNLLTCDFTLIRDTILRYRPPRTPKPKRLKVKKLGVDPLESVLTALWLTLAEFKSTSENRGRLAHGIVREIQIESLLFKHDCDGPTADDQKQAAGEYLGQLLGGLDDWLERYIVLESESALAEEGTVLVSSKLLKDDIDAQYSATAEPRLDFSVCILPEEGNEPTLARFSLRLPESSPFRIADELLMWVRSELMNAREFFLPVFCVPYYDELLLAKDEAEAARVLMHGTRSEEKRMLDLLRPVLAELKPEEAAFAESLKKLASQYGAFVKEAASKGLYSALATEWDALRQAFTESFDVFLTPSDPDHAIDTDHGAILQRLFLVIKERDNTPGCRWIWDRHEPSGVITTLHPALLELLHARVLYLFQCFNAESNKQLRATGPRCFKKSVWEHFVELATVKMPLCGLLKDENRVFETFVRGEHLIHRIGEPDFSDAALSTRLLLRYDTSEDEDISDQEMFRQTRESLMLFRLLKDYCQLHPHAQDGINIAVYQNEDVQPLIAAINQLIGDDETRTTGNDISYHVAVTIFSESGDDAGICRWIDQWKERWEAAELQENLSHYRECRLSVSHRIVTPDKNYEQLRKIIRESLEVDIVILCDFVKAGEQGNEFETVPTPHDVTTRPIKFPILEKTFSSLQEDRHAQKRFRVLSNRQFALATRHTEVMARLRGMARANYVALGCGDFTQWRPVIDELHKNTEWVICIDSSVDERLLRETKDGSVREIIGFGSGVGTHGEANYTVSTEQFHFSDLRHKLKASISGVFAGWSPEDHDRAAQFTLRQASGLSGLSLVRATGIGHHIRDVMAYALARRVFQRTEDTLCDQFVSLDAYRHWFDGAETNMRPDILWITARIKECGALHLDMRLIECKLANRSELHLEKAHQQLEWGLRHLIGAFMPRQVTDEAERPDARYWWLQLHRLVASKSEVSSKRKEEMLDALERLADGDYSVSWGATAFTCWTDDPSEEVKEATPWLFHFGAQDLDISTVSAGSAAVLRICEDEETEPFKFLDNCLSFAGTEAKAVPKEPLAREERKQLEQPPKPSAAPTESSGKEGETHDPQGRGTTLKTGKPEGGGPVPEASALRPEVTPSPKVPERILLGQSTSGARPVFWEFGHIDLHNRHMLIFGSSGMGKTYAIQCMLGELGYAGQNSLVVDYTNGFLPSQLEPATMHLLSPKQHIVRQSPLPISPFKLQAQVIGDDLVIPESASTAAKRIAAIFAVVYDLGDQQFSVLFDAIMQGMQSFGEAFVLSNLLDVLQSFIDGKTHTKSTVQSTMSKLKPFIMDRPFAPNAEGIGWESLFCDITHLCHVFQLAGLDMHSWRLVTEFLLWDLYAFVRGSGDKDSPRVVVLDEIQNLDHREGCPLARYLTEGRKFGLSLILATQTLSNLAADQQSRLFQAGHKLFFRPAETEMAEYGKVLQNATGEPSRTWIERLSKLRKGECYSLGPSLGENDVLKQVAFKIRVASLEERTLGAQEH